MSSSFGVRLEALQDRLGHRFNDLSLLKRAMTHSSYSNERGGAHNERLEFLGDAILDAVIAQLLFKRFPRASEGVLSHQKHQLVQEGTLAAIGKDLGIALVLRVGAGARKDGVHHKPAKLEDATEALVAALFLDAGFEQTVQIISPWFEPFFESLLKQRPRGPEAYKNATSRLHELVARPPLRTRAHEVVIEKAGTAHEPIFKMGWWVGGVIVGEGSGPSKKVALRQAAAVAVETLESMVKTGWRPDPEAEPPSEDA